MYSMLSTPEAASDVFFDPQDGVLAGLSAGKSLVDCATLQVEVRACVRACAQLLRCPVIISLPAYFVFLQQVVDCDFRSDASCGHTTTTI